VYVAASCSFVNRQTVAAGGDVVHVRVYVMTVAGDGSKHFLIGVEAQVPHNFCLLCAFVHILL